MEKKYLILLVFIFQIVGMYLITNRAFAANVDDECFTIKGNFSARQWPSNSKIRVWCYDGRNKYPNSPCVGDSKELSPTDPNKDGSFELHACDCTESQNGACLHVENVPQGCVFAQDIGVPQLYCGMNTHTKTEKFGLDCKPPTTPACGTPCNTANGNKDCEAVKDCSACISGTCLAPPASTPPPGNNATDTPPVSASTDTPTPGSPSSPPGQPTNTPTPPYVCTPGTTACTCAEGTSCATCNNGTCSNSVCTTCSPPSSSPSPSPSPSAPPVCGQPCSTSDTSNPNKDCTNVKDCSICVNNKCQAPTPTPTEAPNAAMCKCAGLQTSDFVAGQDTKITAFATTTDAKQKVVKQFGFSFLGGNIEPGPPVLVSATPVPGDPNKFSADWTVNIPANLTAGTIYQVIAVPQCALTSQKQAMNIKSSRAVLDASTSSNKNIFQQVLGFFASLFMGNTQTQSSGNLFSFNRVPASPSKPPDAVQMYTFPRAKIVEQGCTWTSFEFKQK